MNQLLFDMGECRIWTHRHNLNKSAMATAKLVTVFMQKYQKTEGLRIDRRIFSTYTKKALQEV